MLCIRSDYEVLASVGYGAFASLISASVKVSKRVAKDQTTVLQWAGFKLTSTIPLKINSNAYMTSNKLQVLACREC